MDLCRDSESLNGTGERGMGFLNNCWEHLLAPPWPPAQKRRRSQSHCCLHPQPAIRGLGIWGCGKRFTSQRARPVLPEGNLSISKPVGKSKYLMTGSTKLEPVYRRLPRSFYLPYSLITLHFEFTEFSLYISPSRFSYLLRASMFKLKHTLRDGKTQCWGTL